MYSLKYYKYNVVLSTLKLFCRNNSFNSNTGSKSSSVFPLSLSLFLDLGAVFV